MQNRNIAVCIILSIITCGIYQIYWFICVADDTNELNQDPDAASGGMAFLFSLITCGIYEIYWSYKNGERINEAKWRRGLPGDTGFPIAYLFLTLFGLSIVTLAIMQNDLNKMIDPYPGS